MKNPNINGISYRYPDDSGERLVWIEMAPREREREFAELVMRFLAVGIIPGPTVLNEKMGYQRRRNLGGNLSKIRRSVFQGAGLVRDETRDKWVWPSQASMQASGRAVRA
jgi:hypothetical protein